MAENLGNLLQWLSRRRVAKETIHFIDKLYRLENILGLSVQGIDRLKPVVVYLTGKFLYFANDVVELQNYLRSNDIFPQRLIITMPELKAELPYPELHVTLELYFQKAS